MNTPLNCLALSSQSAVGTSQDSVSTPRGDQRRRRDGRVGEPARGAQRACVTGGPPDLHARADRQSLVVAPHRLAVVGADRGEPVVDQAGGVDQAAVGEPVPRGGRPAQPGRVARDAVVQLGGHPDVQRVGHRVLVRALPVPPHPAAAGAGVPQPVDVVGDGDGLVEVLGVVGEVVGVEPGQRPPLGVVGGPADEVAVDRVRTARAGREGRLVRPRRCGRRSTRSVVSPVCRM